MIIDSTTISGLAAGGLPDASVTTSDIADANITAAKLSGGQSGSAPIYGCRAWCVFDGTLTGTNSPAAGGNVTSVTRNGAGDYTVTFTSALPDANFAANVTACQATPVTTLISQLQGTAPTTTTVRIQTANSLFTLTDGKIVSVAIFR